MSVRVDQVKVALSPLGISGWGFGLQTLLFELRVKDVHIADPENRAPPPADRRRRREYQVEVALANAKAGERGIPASIQESESYLLVEPPTDRAMSRTARVMALICRMVMSARLSHPRMQDKLPSY